MKRVVLFLLFSVYLHAGNQATQTLQLTFGVVNSISFTNPVVQIPLIIDQADLGGGLQKKVNQQQGLCYQTNTEGKKIIAYLDRPTPANTFLSVEIFRAIGTSRGQQVLTNYPVDLVVDIPATTCPGTDIRYTWEANIKSGPMEISTFVVTYAIVGS